MEKATLTKLYEVLAQKVGRSEAECLTQYIEIKVKEELNTKTEILATKQDVFVLKEEIHELRRELTGEIHGLRNEMKGEINGLRTEMKDNSLALQKWMLATFITLVTMIMGLYAVFVLKH